MCVVCGRERKEEGGGKGGGGRRRRSIERRGENKKIENKIVASPW